jgi:plastocyanin
MTRCALAALILSVPACRGVPYRPRTRPITVTTVPLLTKEMAAVYPFLKADFAAQGVLAGKEVYAFVPSTIVAYAGDTLEITFVNPEDDAHTFVLPNLAVALPGQSRKAVRYPVGAPGIYPFQCNIAAHAPMMSGQLVVLESTP